ncbi:hypothetical protein C5F56_29385, partial [Escherichia coli]
ASGTRLKARSTRVGYWWTGPEEAFSGWRGGVGQAGQGVHAASGTRLKARSTRVGYWWTGPEEAFSGWRGGVG